MFYDRGEIDRAVSLAEKIFGKSNQYRTWSEGKIMLNVALTCPKYGKIWFGDLIVNENPMATTNDLQDKLNILSDSLNQVVRLTDGDYGTILITSNTKLNS